MKKNCRFKDCSAYAQINAVYVDTKSGMFELFWCTKCGRIQNKF